jgi:Zn-dependent protease
LIAQQFSLRLDVSLETSGSHLLDLNLTAVLITFGIVIVALTIHEAAHAWTADKLGDPTARLLGRVSLNPVVHIDPIGTILLPLIATITGLMVLGWAKPVPVNISRLRHHRRDFMIVAAAGPISNFLQALVLAAAYHAVHQPGTSDLFPAILWRAVEVNLGLAFFNLIPIPPLDGGNVLAGLVPESAARMLDQVRQFGFIALYLLLYSGILGQLIGPPIDFFLRLLLL